MATAGQRVRGQLEALVRATRDPENRLRACMRRAVTLWPWIPVLLAGLYAILFVANARSLVQAVYWHGDVVSAPYIGELYRQAPAGATVVLGNIPWFPALWFELATHGLPAHRQIWELAPYVISLLGIGLVAWSAFKAGGRWAAITTGAVLFAACPFLLRLQFGWSIHALTYFEVAVLGALLTLTVSRGGLIGRPTTHRTLIGLVGVIAAFGLASDKLLIWTGLAPFILTALAMVRIDPRLGHATVRVALGVTVIAGVGALLLQRIITADHIIPVPFAITLSPYEKLGTHVLLAVRATAYLFDGEFGGLPLTFTSALKLACAAVVTVALLAALWVAGRQFRKLGRHRTRAPATAATVHLTFWSLVLCATVLAYVMSSVSIDVFTGRYLVPAAYALPALLTVMSMNNLLARAAVIGGVSIVVLGATVASARHQLQADPEHFPNGSVSGPLARLARKEGLKYGYAGYWDAATLGWQTKEAVQVFPVDPCGPGLCAHWLHYISTWYVPRPHVRTFLISDPTQSPNPLPVASLGKPEQTVQIGELTVYVFPYDIASKLQRR